MLMAPRGVSQEEKQRKPKEIQKGGQDIGMGNLLRERWEGDSPDGGWCRVGVRGWDVTLAPSWQDGFTDTSLWTSVSLIQTMTPMVFRNLHSACTLQSQDFLSSTVFSAVFCILTN